jgi:hypothetical protein
MISGFGIVLWFAVAFFPISTVNFFHLLEQPSLERTDSLGIGFVQNHALTGNCNVQLWLGNNAAGR